MSSVTIEQTYKDPVINLALDTIGKQKQALVFCNTRRGAASQAEKIAQKVKETSPTLKQLSEKILGAVSSPTKQCKRLAACVAKGSAFHHAGLNARQRDLVETAFREGVVSIVCSTPTLAMGMDLPAYRAIIRDLKRFSSGTSWGMANIPVLEFEQMAGRAGRPGKDDSGQAICIAKTAGEAEKIVEMYLHGEPEEIYSKLAVEPVLRTYVLSLIASGMVHNTEELYQFFDETFYAFQYGDTTKLHSVLDKMTHLLAEWNFVTTPNRDFASAADIQHETLEATQLGERVAQLYLDPYTAHHVLQALEKGEKRSLSPNAFPLLHLMSSTLEIRPLPSIRQKDYELLDGVLVEREQELFVKAPDAYSHEYDEYLQSIKLAVVLDAWIDERGEDRILEEYNVTPGELQAKRRIVDWLLYATIELCKLTKRHGLIRHLEKLRIRVANGVKEDVLPLLRLKGVGRVRARQLFKHRMRTLEDLRTAEFSQLRGILGEKLALTVKEQLGQKVKPEDLAVKRNKRKGQINLQDF